MPDRDRLEKILTGEVSETSSSDKHVSGLYEFSRTQVYGTTYQQPEDAEEVLEGEVFRSRSVTSSMESPEGSLKENATDPYTLSRDNVFRILFTAFQLRAARQADVSKKGLSQLRVLLLAA